MSTDSSGRERFFPAAALDQKTGAIYSVYYDRRNTEGDFTEVYLSRSVDGGNTFSDARLSAQPFLPDSLTFLGDYIGISANNRVVVPVWTEESEDHTTGIWTSMILDTAISSGMIVRASSTMTRAAPSSTFADAAHAAVAAVSISTVTACNCFTTSSK